MRVSTKAADAVDKVVISVGGKFNGLTYDIGKHTAQSVIIMRHSVVSKILDVRPCSESVYIRPRTISATSRPTRAVTRNQVVDESATLPPRGGKTPANQDAGDRSSASSPEHETSARPVSCIASFTICYVDDNICNNKIQALHHNNKLSSISCS